MSRRDHDIDYSRIRGVVDLERMRHSCVTVIGTGGSAGLCQSLARCGLGSIQLIDRDVVEASNVARQEHFLDWVGRPKVTALKHELNRINRHLAVTALHRDFCTIGDDEADRLFAATSLFVFGTDNHAAQARGNELALRLGKPAVWIGLYEGGRAGEVVFWKPGLVSCYRCLCAARYEAFAAGSVNPPSAGATVLAVQFLDAIAGMLIVGLLTAGADNRFGRLIADLGERNFIQAKLDPSWTFHGRDTIRERLGIPDGNDAYFSFNAVALRDPDRGEPPCPDCARFRERQPGP